MYLIQLQMTSILEILPVTFGERHCAFIVILNFVIIQISQVKVYLHLGTYSLHMIEGMV